MNKEAIVGIAVSFVMLSIGIFAFYTLLVISNDMSEEMVERANMSDPEIIERLERVNETIGLSNTALTILGGTVIIGAILSVAGLVYYYFKPEGDKE